jgi:hypothetical protein
MGWWLDLPIQPKQTGREQGMTKIDISSIYCAAPSVVCDALRDLEMILAAGMEGLEPAFALLDSARP